jgi:hypothetical protein
VLVVVVEVLLPESAGGMAGAAGSLGAVCGAGGAITVSDGVTLMEVSGTGVVLSSREQALNNRAAIAAAIRLRFNIVDLL